MHSAHACSHEIHNCHFKHIERIMGFCKFWGYIWGTIVVYVHSSTMLRCGSYKKLVSTTYPQQQLRYDADLVLRVVAN